MSVKVDFFGSPSKTIWVGLRFQNGEDWIWSDGTTGPINWDSKYSTSTFVATLWTQMYTLNDKRKNDFIRVL